MEKLKLVIPSEEHRAVMEDFKREFIENKSSMDGFAGFDSRTFEEWLCFNKNNRQEETVQAGWIPASTFLAFRQEDEKLVGMIDIRHRLNDYLLHFGGHIGYSVRPSERRKGYASEMLRLALEQAKNLHLEKVLITCNKNNVPSARTIISNGGILENEEEHDSICTQRYWITIK